MEEDADVLNQLIAKRVSALRSERGLSLDALAERSGVSRSMISLIERGESNPTAVVLAKLAMALGVTTASMFDSLQNVEGAPPSPLSKYQDQKEWRDPATGYVRRNLSPQNYSHPLQLVEVKFPGSKRVTFDNHMPDSNIYEQVWVLEGQMELTLGGETFRLHAGDCLALRLDVPVAFFNPLKKTARYLVALTQSDRRG